MTHIEAPLISQNNKRQPGTYILVSSHHEVYTNLAIEETLQQNIRNDQFFVLLYRNTPSVVIGKHQNPWKECDMSYLEENDIQLARRISGGGAVYHDLGNVNVSFISPKPLHDQKAEVNRLVSILNRMGIKVRLGSHNDIYMEDKKISGNARCVKKYGVIHHATLLVETNLQHLRGSLKPPAMEIDGHSTASRPAHVANITDKYHDLTTEIIMDRLVLGFETETSCLRKPLAEFCRIDRLRNEKREERKDPDWILGRTPTCEVPFSSSRLGNGMLRLKDGMIQAVYKQGSNHVHMHINAKAQNIEHTARILTALQAGKRTEAENDIMEVLSE